MASITRFEDIQAWQQARKLVREIYAASELERLRGDFGLKGQLCRAAVSAMSNIAEGFARKSDREFARFLDMARGSAFEVQSLLYVALDVGYIAPGEFQRLYDIARETVALVGGFTSYLRTNTRPRKPKSRKPNFGPRIPNSAPKTSDPGPVTSDLGLQTSDLGLRTSDSGLRTEYEETNRTKNCYARRALDRGRASG